MPHLNPPIRSLAAHLPQMKTRQWRILLLSVLSVAWLIPVLSNVGHAAEPNKRLTINDLSKVDADFQLSGEYQGCVRNSNGVSELAGLQIVAQGDGQFRAMYYKRGLPGSGWDRQKREVLQGQRSGDLLELVGESRRVEMVNLSPTVYDNNGSIVGTLGKVHRVSPTMGMRAPPNALTLFDGTDTNAFKDGRMTEEGLLEEGTELLSMYRNFTLHAEFRLPYMPHARGQDRSNSGFYLLSSYEVQVLDSFGLEGIKNECGALYRYKQPDLNMCLPPLQWQTYDITFRSPTFDSADNKICNGRITVLHNGVAVHNNFEIERKTGAGKPESSAPRPIKLQDHSNPIRYRNIWLIDLDRACRCIR